MYCFFCLIISYFIFFFFSSRRRHTRSLCDWSSDVCSSDLLTDRDDRVFPVAANHVDVEVGHDAADRHSGMVREEIGRASCREKCRSRGSAEHEKKKKNRIEEVDSTEKHKRAYRTSDRQERR